MGQRQVPAAGGTVLSYWWDRHSSQLPVGQVSAVGGEGLSCWWDRDKYQLLKSRLLVGKVSGWWDRSRLVVGQVSTGG